MSVITGITRADALHQATPDAQIEHYRRVATQSGRNFDESHIPELPQFSPTTPSEVLLLHEVHQPDDGRGIVPSNFDKIWNTIQIQKKFDLEVDTLVDLAGDPTPGFTWMGFDPLGVVIDEERDFRPDRYINREVYPGSLQGFVPGSFSGTTQPSTIAGLELLSAISSMPAVVYGAWADGREYPLSAIMPRLEAMGQWGLGVFEMHWWTHDGIRCWPQPWTYNHYGHPWVIPKIRAL